MQILATSLNNCPIFDIQSSKIIGTIIQPIINPANCRVIAYSVKSPTSKAPNYLLAISTLINNHNLVLVKSEEDISPAEDLIRYKAILKANINLLNYYVITQSGQNIGRINDYRIDSHTCNITKLHIKAKSFQRLWQDNRIIDRSEIVEIKNKKVIIKDSLSKSKIRLKSTLPAKNS